MEYTVCEHLNLHFTAQNFTGWGSEGVNRTVLHLQTLGMGFKQIHTLAAVLELEAAAADTLC